MNCINPNEKIKRLPMKHVLDLYFGNWFCGIYQSWTESCSKTNVHLVFCNAQEMKVWCKIRCKLTTHKLYWHVMHKTLRWHMFIWAPNFRTIICALCNWGRKLTFVKAPELHFAQIVQVHSVLLKKSAEQKKQFQRQLKNRFCYVLLFTCTCTSQGFCYLFPTSSCVSCHYIQTVH